MVNKVSLEWENQPITAMAHDEAARMVGWS